MIRIKINGGLGNQLFQYATAYAMSRKLKSKMIIDISESVKYRIHPLRLTKLNCSGSFDSKESLIDNFLLHPRLIKFSSKFIKRYYIESTLRYDENLQRLAGNKLLIGYFQSEKYFSEYRAELLQEFFPSKAFSEYQKKIKQKIESVDSLSIHIRRGDYISNSDASDVHGICNKEYFDRAITHLTGQELISINTVIFVFSDDIPWCKENLHLPYKVVFIEGDAKSPELDMWLMSYCKNNIISNSTFSWWGGWLNTHPSKCVIAPLKWFKTLHDSKDIVPEGWKRL